MSPDERPERRPDERPDERPDRRPVLRPAGPAAVLVEVADTAAALALAAWVRSAGWQVTEVVPGARTVLLDGVLPGLDLGQLEARLGRWARDAPPARGPTAAPPVEVVVRWDGPDLAWVADRWGCSEPAVVARMEALELTAAFCGFAPGFAYLAGLPAGLAVPRLDTPRTRVPAGSVGLAGTWCGIYPSASPGGWRLLGTTDAVLWDAARAEPALLPPGTGVRLRGEGR